MRRLVASFFLVLCVVSCAGPGPIGDVDPLEAFLDAGFEAVRHARAQRGEAFREFREGMAAAAEQAGDEELARTVRGLEPGRRVAPDERTLASRVLRHYVMARYGVRMITDLQHIVGFRTYAEEGRENWQAPEFVRQRQWLETRAGQLGLDFQSVDGRVEEIVLAAGGGERVIGVLTHGDVQGVEGQTWSVPPWDGRQIGERIVGRGTEDDKGPIITTMHVMAALRDSGWPLDAELRLMIANGEESSWEEIPYYLERRDPPDVTLGIDASYPVTHAQKAWCSLDFTAIAATGGAGASPGSWRVLSVSGGSGLSIIAERAAARLEPPAAVFGAAEQLRASAADWAAAHPPARLEVSEGEQGIVLHAHGRGGHSSEPSNGHNAFGDLTAFLVTLELVPDAWGSLVRFIGLAVGTETDGAGLGLAHDDPVMGPLTANLGRFDLHGGWPRARLSLRVPRGLDAATIEARVTERLAAFAQRERVTIEAEIDMPYPPHFVPPDGPLVRTLLAVWEEVTGEPGSPVAIGGGTQSRFFPGGVDFGPAVTMERYRGHGPDEYVTFDEIRRNAELTIAALWALTASGP